MDYADTKGCWLFTLDWWDYEVNALIQGRQGHPSPCMTEAMVNGHGQVGNDNSSGYSVIWAMGGFAEDAGQEGVSSRLALTTIMVAPWCGPADTHGFGIFNAT